MFEKWLKTAILLFGALFLLLLCVAAIGMIRIESSLVSISSDVKQASEFIKDTTQNIAEMRSQIESLKQTVSSIADPQEIADEVSAAALAVAEKGGETPLDPRAKEEIDYMLACIGTPEYRYEYEGKIRSAGWTRLKLSSKFAAYRGGVKSAEDFIESVASTTHEGAPYYIVMNGKEKKPLRSWLQEMLAQHRAEAKPTEK